VESSQSISSTSHSNIHKILYLIGPRRCTLLWIVAIEANLYRKQLRQLHKEVIQKCSQIVNKVILLHDNARPHVMLRRPRKHCWSWNGKFFRIQLTFTSPDITPSDYNLFRSIAARLIWWAFQMLRMYENRSIKKWFFFSIFSIYLHAARKMRKDGKYFD